MSANLKPCVPTSNSKDTSPLKGVGESSSSSSSLFSEVTVATNVSEKIDGEDHHQVKESRLDGNADDEDEDGYHTPTSPRHRIPAALDCPPAPRKPPVRLRFKKRKSSYFVQIKDVELMLCEGKRPIKKAREEVASSE